MALAIFSITSINSVYSQSSYFFKSYDFPPFSTRTEIGRSIEKTSATQISGWSVAGFSNSTPNAGGYDWMFLKLSPMGLLNCTALLGFPLDDSCFSHIQLNDVSKKFVLAGFYRQSDGKEKASWSMLDTNCNHIMTKMISDPFRHQYRQIITEPSNTFENAGFIEMPMGSLTPNKILVTKYNPAGVMLWGFKYITPVPSTDEAYSICFQPADGGYAVCGRTNFFSGTAGAFDVFVVKLNTAGIPLWNRVYRLPMMGSSSNAYRIISMPDGGYVVIGWTNTFDVPANDIWVFRINPLGLLAWSFAYGLPGIHERGHSIVYEASNNSLTFTGFTTSSGNQDILIGNLNAATGAPNWFRKYTNPPGNEMGYDIENAANPSGYALTGQLFAPPSISLDAFLMRTDASGKVTPVCLDSLMLQQTPAPFMLDSLHFSYMEVLDMPVQPQVVNSPVQIREFCVLTGNSNMHNSVPGRYSLEQNYPNPFNPSTRIEFSLPVDEVVSIKVFDATGREVTTLINGFKNKGNYSIDFNASNLSNGVYFYKLEAEGYSNTKKMVLVK